VTPPTLVRDAAVAPAEITLRPAMARDVDGIVALIAEYAAEQIMLPRTPESVLLALHDFVVATDAHGTVLGCGALKEYSPSLAEVSSLAVSRAAHGKGLGRRIVACLERLARARGIGELFALTLTPEFFGAVGYEVVDRARYPEKIRRDCLGCARRVGCREVCVARSVAAGVEARAAA
jgi:N-acetylglutamate synthase-like GNAT family acetyltransferase